MHLYDTSPCVSQGIVRAFKEYKVEKVAPCHCSGDHVIRQFKEAYGAEFIFVGTGAHIFL